MATEPHGRRDDSVRTVLDRPAGSRPPSPPSTPGTVATPELALRAVEARRAWVISVGMAGLSVVAFAIVLGMGGDPLAQHIHLATLGITGVAAIAHVVFYRDPRTYKLWRSQTLGYISISTVASGYFYWGEFSAFIAVVPISGYVFASSASRLGAWVGCLACIVVHVAIGVAQLSGWVGEHGLVHNAAVFSVGMQIAVLVLLQLVVMSATLGGVDAKRTMTAVLAEQHAALRAVAQRDALLAEAHAEMRDARAAGEGRYSGQRFGRFLLGAVLGRGAMGEVYAAEDDTGSPCALKVLAAYAAHDPEIVKRFQREARAIGALDAPNIVRMIEVSPIDAPIPYFAMERLDGKDLGELIQDRPRRETAEVVSIISAAAAGLDAAHAAGVVHRDLKPANIFAAGEGAQVVWKLLDFGVAKVAHGDATATVGQIIGTPGYMAPEQARGEPVDRRVDVYALGVVAYRLLTGTPAIVPGDLPAMIHEVVYRMPPRPSEVAQISADVEAVLAIALAKSRDDRFATAGELAVALAAAAAGTVSSEITARAASILGRTPWGSWQRRGHDGSPRQRANPA